MTAVGDRRDEKWNFFDGGKQLTDENWENILMLSEFGASKCDKGMWKLELEVPANISAPSSSPSPTLSVKCV